MDGLGNMLSPEQTRKKAGLPPTEGLDCYRIIWGHNQRPSEEATQMTYVKKGSERGTGHEDEEKEVKKGSKVMVMVEKCPKKKSRTRGLNPQP